MSNGLDPDPLRPPETDELMPAAEYIDGYDAGYEDAERARPPLLQTTAFGLGVVVGMFLAVVLIVGAAGVR